MKKFFALVLAAMLVLSLAACDASSNGEVQSPSDVATSSDGTDASQTETSQTEETLSETVLVDEAGVKITAKGLDLGGMFGPELKLLVENNSGKDLTFQSRNTSVNGYMVETMMSVDVVNGKSANDGLTFMSSDLEACGIQTIADMEFSFHIFTTEDLEDYLRTPPIQLKTSAFETYAYTYDDTGSLAYEGNGVRIVIKGLAKDDSFFGPSVVAYIENTSDRDITVQTKDVSVNGFMVDAMFSCDVLSGKHAVDGITFLSSDLEENEITEIENIELSFHIFETTGWDTIVDTDTVSITF